MDGRRALPYTILAALLLLGAALLVAASAGVAPVVWAFLCLGALAMLATAVLLARRPDDRPAADPRPRTADPAWRERAERLATVGRLAAGVAHEVNNPLTGALTYAHLLANRTDLPEDARMDAQRIARSTERVREIVKRLLDFARETPMRRERTDVNELAREALELVRKQAELGGVELSLVPGDGLPAAVVDRSRMVSVVLNLLLNALDATPSGGSVTVSTRSAPTEPTDAAYPRPGVEIAVADTGSGIPERDLGRIFDPFYTTKDPGSGTGLGLSVSHGIVAGHGGEIHVSSSVGSGSCFTVWIPAEEDR